MDKTNPISVRMLQIDRNLSDPGLDSLEINTTYSQRSELEIKFNLEIKDLVITDYYSVEHTGFKRMRVPITIRLGCFEQKHMYIKARPEATDNINFISYTHNELRMVYPKMLTKTNFNLKIDMLLDFYSELELCGAYKIQIFEDSLFKIQVKQGAPTFMESDPTLLDLETGEFDPVINVTYGTPQIPMPYSVYFRVSTENTTYGVTINHFQLKFELCENKPELKTPEPHMVRISQKSSTILDLNELFVHKIDYRPACDEVEFLLSTHPTEIRPIQFQRLTLTPQGILSIEPVNFGNLEFFVTMKSLKSFNFATKHVKVEVETFCSRENVQPL